MKETGMSRFDQQMLKQQEQIEAVLKNYSQYAIDSYNHQVHEAMSYSLLARGKRLRAHLLMASYQLFQPYTQTVDAFLVAIEMIHAYSLIHDDLPAMDNDVLRRGVETCHVKYGEAMAILAGDGLLNKAFEIMLDSVIEYNLGEAGIRAIKVLSAKAGTEGMLGGQVAELTFEEKMDMDIIRYVHTHKTAALIEGALMMGGYLANQGEEVIHQLEHLGYCIGMAFQIQDDLLDVVSTEALLGKPIGSDQKNQKVTYVDLKGIEGAQKDIDDLMEQALAIIEKLEGTKTAFLKELVVYIWKRER